MIDGFINQLTTGGPDLAQEAGEDHGKVYGKVMEKTPEL